MAEQYQQLELDDSAIAEMAGVVKTHGQILILVLTEDYCPDAVLNLPIAARLTDAISGLQMRIVRRVDYEELALEYPADDGFNHIPTLIFLAVNGAELSVWHERPTAAHNFLAEYHAENPQPTRHTNDGETTSDFKIWAKTRLSVQKQLYRETMWRETVKEFVGGLK